MVTASPKLRVDGYIRVSRVGKRRGPRFISPVVQRDAIEGWAARQGASLLEIFEEMDESGARRDRPLLERAVRRIESGGSAGLVVWRVDRFGRSLIDGLHCIDRVRHAGGTFYSVQEGLDSSTDAGRLVLRILLSVAEFRLDGIREGWEESRKRAIRRGLHMPKMVPVGYKKTRSGRLVPHPETGPVIQELFARRVAGASLLECARFLEERHVLTGKGNPGWSSQGLSDMIRSRVYVGEVHCGRYVNSHAHEPLVDLATWAAAAAPRGPVIPPTHPALLKGMIRCAGCRHAMRPLWVRGRDGAGYRMYGCSKRHARGVCSAPAMISGTKVEPYVIDAAFRVLARRRKPAAARVEAAAAKLASATRSLTRYRDDDRVAETIGHDAYLDGLRLRQARLQQAALAVVDAREASRYYGLPSATELRRTFSGLPVKEQREILRQVLDVVFVSAGRASAEARVTICPAGTAPHDLPHPGDRGRNLIPIKPRRGWMNPVR